MQGVQVRSLLGELKPHMLHGMAERNRSGRKGGRRAFLPLLLNPPNTVMFLIKERCGYFQGGTQQYVWGDVVLFTTDISQYLHCSFVLLRILKWV